MKVKYENSIEYQIVKWLESSKSTVVLRKDFEGLGSYRQISRALNKLIKRKQLVKISYGIFAKSYESKYIDQPLIQNGFDIASREALDRLMVEWELSRDERAYNEGRSQQVPMQSVVRLKSRCRRKISYAGRTLYFEGNTNAR